MRLLDRPRASPAAQDLELLERLRDADTDALDELLRRFWTPLVAYLARLLGGRDAAEDVAQRTFCTLWVRREEWSGTGSVRGLIYRVARNFAISDHRTDEARLRAGVALAGRAQAVATPLDLLEQEQLRRALDAAVQALPERRREVFVLRCMNDLSYKEIAEVMGTSPQTVANQLSRALSTLRRVLGNQLDG